MNFVKIKWKNNAFVEIQHSNFQNQFHPISNDDGISFQKGTIQNFHLGLAIRLPAELNWAAAGRWSQSFAPSFKGVYLSWKVRYRTSLWFVSQMIKLYGARSRLYRRQILQVNIRWKALDEIYKIYMLLHRSDLNISENFRQTFSHFSAKILQKIVIFEFFSLILLKFWWNFVGISPII